MIRNFSELRMIFRQQRQAKRWVQQGGVKVAVHCLFHLNRLVGALPYYSDLKPQIYLLKSRLIEYLYLNGRCIDIQPQVQKMACWHTRGYNEGWDVHCWKCNNTGIYRQHYLIRFVFDVNGRTYVWHQPESHVNYIALIRWEDEPIAEYVAGDRWEGSVLWANKPLTSLYLAALAHFLVGAGMDGDGLVSRAGLLTVGNILEMFRDTLHPNIRRFFKYRFNRFRYWLAMRVPVRFRDRIDPEWEIPF